MLWRWVPHLVIQKYFCSSAPSCKSTKTQQFFKILHPPITDKIIYSLWWKLHQSAHGKYKKSWLFYCPVVRTYFAWLKRPKYISGLIDFHRPGTEQIALNSLIILNNLIMITFISHENIFIIALPSGIDIAPLQSYILRFAVPLGYCNTNCTDLNWYNINTLWRLHDKRIFVTDAGNHVALWIIKLFKTIYFSVR